MLWSGFFPPQTQKNTSHGGHRKVKRPANKADNLSRIELQNVLNKAKAGFLSFVVKVGL
jgi:hypothetical protein